MIEIRGDQVQGNNFLEHSVTWKILLNFYRMFF